MKLISFDTIIPNFGDDLNTEIWPKLAPELFEADDGDGFLGIGTIIGMPVSGVRRLTVFSSGAGYDPLDGWQVPINFSCVRGPLTGRLFGLGAEFVLTDGAILTPLVDGFPLQSSPSGRVAVVPHWESKSFRGWEEACQMAGFDLIDPCRPPKTVVAEIAAASLVLTESLHGAIVADSYDIEWMPFSTTKNFSVFKWKDWTMSVGADLEVTAIPPPSAEAILCYGRPVTVPWGCVARYDASAAQDEFDRRLAHASHAKPNSRLARWPRAHLIRAANLIFQRLPITRRLTSFNPARTAEELTNLTRRRRFLSRKSLRLLLQERLVDHLFRLNIKMPVQ